MIACHFLAHFVIYIKLQTRACGMLDDWEENLAIITANRTKDDELVMIHLGDCLWKERGEVCVSSFSLLFSFKTLYIQICLL